MYCVKCRTKTSCSNVIIEQDIRGKPRYHGMCNHCGTHCFQYAKLNSVNKMKY